MKQVKFILATHQARDNAIRHIQSEVCNGKREVIIRDKESARSIAQNKLYQKWSKIMADEIGYTHRQMKNVLKMELLPSRMIKNLKGEEVEVWPSTKDLTMRNFSKFLHMIEMLAAEQGIILPKRDDDWLTAMGEKYAA